MKHTPTRFFYIGYALLSLALGLFLPDVGGAEPRISEILASNNRGLRDADGDASDWIEIYNPGPEVADLSGWALTDDARNLRKWVFPDGVTLAPGQSLVVFASGKDRRQAGQELHTNFSLNAAGEYLALIKPDGVTPTTEFAPAYPPQREDVSYGFPQRWVETDLVGDVTPDILVPADSGASPWEGGASEGWLPGTAPGAIGYDTISPVETFYNVALEPGTVAEQSSGTTYPASRAIDGNENNYTQTIGNTTDPTPWWEVTLAEPQAINLVSIVNRTTNQHRLRDLTVELFDASGALLWTSPVLNPQNALNGPAIIDVPLEPINGQLPRVKRVRITRQGDPSLPNNLDRYVLSLAEVKLLAPLTPGRIPAARNLARDAGVTASQSSTLSGFPAANAINGEESDYSQTNPNDTNARWTLDLKSRKVISAVTLYNRRGQEWASRLRDITVTIRDADNSTITFTSPLLNPENEGYFYPRGPETLHVDLTALAGGPVLGRYVEVKRTPDPDLSGSGGVGDAADQNALALAEVAVYGHDPLPGYRRLIATDVQERLYQKQTSLLARLSFTVDDPSRFRSLQLRLRSDDGAAAWLNGTEVVRRRAPGGELPWNAAALSTRDTDAGQTPEIIDLAPQLSLLQPGTNRLTLHGLTADAHQSHFLLWAQLMAGSVEEASTPQYLATPTPGALNDTKVFAGWVEEVVFSAPRGFYSAPFDLELSTATPDTQIYYTLNAEDPTPAQGTLYTGPIRIAETTVVRACAYKDGWEPTPIYTQTYLFLADVIGQAADGKAPPGWPASWGANTVDYGMDPAVRTLYGDAALIEALQQIPSLSLVTPKANLFDPQTGIYANALQQGRAWERPASIEFLDPKAPPGAQGLFQADCGVRIRGGYSRNPEFRKHSFRVYFRREYGPGKLRYPLFGPQGADQFDVIDLASSQNYSWARDTSGADTMLRDPLARETQLATGSPGSRTRYFHLYVDGLYWGLYWFDERPSAGYGQAYFGGNGETWDVVKTGNHSKDFVTEATEGYMDMVPPQSPTQPAQKAAWRLLWEKCRALATAPGNTASGNPDLAAYFDIIGRDASGKRDPSKEVLVDIDSLINYMLNIFWSGDGDAPLSSFLSNQKANNWFAIRDRANPNRGFIFITHDAEHTFGASSSQNNRTGPFIYAPYQNQLERSNPQWIFQDLCYSPEFRIRVADLAHRHLRNNGVMTASSAQARLDRLAAQINLAVKAHAQRWGDAQKRPAFNHNDWERAVAVVRNYLTNRAETVITQLKNYRLTTSYPAGSAPLYPKTEPPRFNQHGGEITPGFTLTMESPDTAGGGVIYYTFDGTDPRQIGGAISQQALTYSAPVSLTQDHLVKARTFKEGEWSALTEALFTVSGPPLGHGSLVISKLLYKPAAPTNEEREAGYTDADDFEYLEITNTGSVPVELAGVRVTGGIEFTFEASTLSPGARAVVAKNPTAFALRYPGVTTTGPYSGQLANSGERLLLLGPDGRVLQDFTYSDTPPWPTAPDTTGHALVFMGTSPEIDPNQPYHWRSSLTPGGNPGVPDHVNYEAWRISHQVSDPQADDDQDGLPAVLEFALGSSPSEFTTSPLQLLGRAPDGSLNVRFPRRYGTEEVTVVLEVSSDLSTWVTPSTITLLAREEAGDLEYVTAHVAGASLPGHGQTCYVRLRLLAP